MEDVPQLLDKALREIIKLPSTRMYYQVSSRSLAFFFPVFFLFFF